MCLMTAICLFVTIASVRQILDRVTGLALSEWQLSCNEIDCDWWLHQQHLLENRHRMIMPMNRETSDKNNGMQQSTGSLDTHSVVSYQSPAVSSANASKIADKHAKNQLLGEDLLVPGHRYSGATHGLTI